MTHLFQSQFETGCTDHQERCKCEQEGREVIWKRSAAGWSCTSLLSGDWLFSWFQHPCCSGQAPSSPGLPSRWLRERQDISPSHCLQGAWEETATSCWEHNLLLGYVASWLPSITAFTRNERDFTSKPSPAGEDGLWMHFERKENEGSIMLKICTWEKDKREVTVKQNTPKHLLLPAKTCYQNVN